MQITVTFRGRNIELPIATGETVQGLIYRALSTDSDFSTRIHDKGNSFEKRSFKLFCFSELKGSYEIRDKSIIYPYSATLEIRSADAYFIQLLFSYFTLNRRVRLGSNDVKVTDLRLSDRSIHTDKVIITTASPITAYITEADGYTRYFSPDEEEFCRLVSANACRKWASSHGIFPDGEIRLSAAGGGKYIKRATRFKDTFITAWHGSFLLEAKPEIISFLYNTGLGSKSSQGFGMFDINEEIVTV